MEGRLKMNKQEKEKLERLHNLIKKNIDIDSIINEILNNSPERNKITTIGDFAILEELSIINAIVNYFSVELKIRCLHERIKRKTD